MPRIRTFRPTAFTLIELLVVVVMLAVVLSLAVSATGKSRDQSRRAQCLEQLHLIGLGLADYSAAHVQTLPMRGLYTYNIKEPQNWFLQGGNGLVRETVNIGMLYGPYCGTDLSLFYCPSDPTTQQDPTYGEVSFPKPAPAASTTWGGYMYGGPVPPGCYPKDDGNGSLTYIQRPYGTPIPADYNYSNWITSVGRQNKRPYRGRIHALVIDKVIGTKPHEDGSNVLFSDYSGRWTPDYDRRVWKLMVTSGSGGRSIFFEAWNVLSTRK